MMRKHVIVVGAGAAGLSAAGELLRNDCTVTVLEARTRCGGRIHTIQHDVLPVELGAEFVHGCSPVLLDALKAARLTTVPTSDQNRLFSGGRLVPVELRERLTEILQRLDPDEPDRSFRQVLEEEAVSASTARLAAGFVEGFHAADPARAGALELREAEESADRMSGDEQSRVVEGYSALIGFLEQGVIRHGGQILHGAVVQQISWKRGQVEIQVHRGAEDDCYTADAAVLTLPVGVFKSGAVKFDPPLPEKEETFRALQVGNVVKIALVFRRAWWSEPDIGFVHALNEAIPTWWSDPRGPILTGWAGGLKATALIERSPEDLTDLALGIVRKIFEGSAREELVASHLHNWSRDPYSLGAYAYLPVNGLDLPHRLAAPVEGTLFFAGEATALDAQTGTVFSAMESGLRAAGEVLSAG